MGEDGNLPLIETKKSAKNRFVFRVYTFSIFISIFFIFYFRFHHWPESTTAENLAWLGAFLSELWFAFYWFLTIVMRWNPSYHHTFKDRLSQRYGKVFPGVDMFVCTADPMIEPPTMVVNTILSLMAYNYPSEKMTFISLMTSSYKDMRRRIKKVAEGFLEWDTVSSRRDHQTILQIIIDGRDTMAVDSEGQPLPTLVYLVREKRPQYSHHFKAGAMNALVSVSTLHQVVQVSPFMYIRISSAISNSPIILTVDCDMYSNDSDSVRDALCFFMDEESGDEIGFVQFPQCFDNLTKNDLYSSSSNVTMQGEIHGMDNYGGPPYMGTGCFHRRETLCGRKYRRGSKSESLRWDHHHRIRDSASALEESCKTLANCGYEESTEWGKEMGLMYGCAAEDVFTGFIVQCRGWRSIYFNPERKGFLGLAPTTLLQSLYCPLLYGHDKIPLKLQLSYCVYLLWAANCLASLFYVTIPSLCLLRGISLFPKVSSQWSFPFIYAIMATSAYSAREFVWCGGTIRGWWNDQRMWVYKRTTSYFFAFLDNILRLIGISKSAFVITAKMADDDVSKRYEQELMEFGASSPMFTILTTLAWLNALSFIGVLLKLAMHGDSLDQLAMQIILCGLLVYVNQPLYEGMFFRKDKARMPTLVTYKSAVFALVACSLACV
ncbi:hypothetical protein EUGRSUZ_H05074 [Eucalyptus grandis]|uniref:Uncharacterized protein n=2 Tax=Eucalyptus grandis TaxID=71139 RepID=A0ACC3JZ54_EUCGR|nr:hypothetical protein EUGRSUZ_H05074 [Eucalyptus grandis]